MQLCQLTLAVPGDSLAEISPELDESRAANLLACWTSLWHPTLLAQARTLPAAVSIDTLAAGDREPGELILVPDVVPESLYGELAPGDTPQVPCIREYASRRKVISHLAENLPIEWDQSAEADYAADFYALGFAYLQMELLTQRMAYNRSEGDQQLTEAVIAAADAAVAGDTELMDTRVVEAYDQLVQSRNHYYPIDFHLVDLSLTAPSTVGGPLEQLCRQATKHNVLITGELLEQLSASEPQTLAALRQAIDEQRLSVCGGTMTNRPPAEHSAESLLAELLAARQVAEQHLGKPLTTFAHYANPLAPLAPGLLAKLGYHSAVLASFGGQTMPDSYSSRTTWTGLDGMPLEALAATPLDMGRASTMLQLPTQMQNAMNYDLAAALLLVGWPGHRTEWYDDLMQVAKRTPLLGRPTTLDNYFEVTTSNDYSGAMSVESYPNASESPETTIDGEPLRCLASVAGGQGDDAAAYAKLLGCSDTDPKGQLTINASSVVLHSGDAEVPAFGWRWIANRGEGQLPARCEPGVLRNEWMEVVFDERTGGISASRPYHLRGNFLSQQLQLVPIGPQGIAAGMQLAFDGWEVGESDDYLGVHVSNSRIVDRNGQTLAAVTQYTSLAAHSQAIDVQVELQPQGSRPPNCALLSRIAVREQDYAMTRNVGEVDLSTVRTKVTTAALGIAMSKMPISVLSDRPLAHRRHSGRMLDSTLLVAAGENVEAGISYWLDNRYPAKALFARTAADWRLTLPTAEPSQPTGWWLHLGARNLLATHFAVEPQADQLLVRLRLLETAGRAVDTQLLAWRPIVAAQQTNFRGEPDQVLILADGRVRLNLAAYEFAEIELLFDLN
ncbi:polysaccharide deacetylase family protein [Aeoliella mucimassa]|uniref:Glycoside hydrolase family 38 N-terminal domain-containing protein n=1 Tax=Aeoliella mucimassa TaxID=2527972 RepID=A0A518AUN4_9BACT|nr:hypothetical protein [Aeoliella mucimassa]QDU58422.1 hypothetical protein Pan181_46570 [Aeoliella mucimassa]